MFPKPVQKSTSFVRSSYSVLVPISLFIWLLPLIAIFMTSVRPEVDITSGNVFGVPSDFLLIENYGRVLAETEALRFFWNSILITVPTVILSISLACLAGYALAHRDCAKVHQRQILCGHLHRRPSGHLCPQRPGRPQQQQRDGHQPVWLAAGGLCVLQ